MASDIKIKNGLSPKSISIDLDPKEWVIIVLGLLSGFLLYLRFGN